MFVTNTVARPQKFGFFKKRKAMPRAVVNNLMGLSLGDPLADEALTTAQLRNALQIVNGNKPLPNGVSMDSYRALAAKAKKMGIKTSSLQGMGDYPDPYATTGDPTNAVPASTSAADYLKAFSDFTNQAANTAAQLATNARLVTQAYRGAPAPVAPAQRAVNSVSNFSRNNTGVMLAIAGGLAAILVLPRLMRR